MLSDLRTSFWHLRKGGIRQLSRHLEHRERMRLEASKDEADIAKVESTKRDRLRGFDPQDFPEYTPNFVRPRPFGQYSVGAILDDFSRMAWGSEFSLIELTPENWNEKVEAIDFLLVESAWHGNDGAWRYQVVGSEAPSQSLRELVGWCRQHGIPTVFWNKEDPEHFNDFILTAELFDFVGTTDIDCVDSYREHKAFDGEVFALPFAAQPSVHNPMRDQNSARHQIGDVCFAGTYFRHKFLQRREQMDLLLNAGIDASENLKSALTIYSRNESVDSKYSFPEPFSEWVVEGLPYTKMLSAYRGYKVFLNVNTVQDSPSMFSRRALEVLASGTPVVSTESAGLRNFFNESEIYIVDEKDEATGAIEALIRSPLTRDHMVHRAQRSIWEKHTYTHRAVDILKRIGFPSTSPNVGTPKATVVMPTMRPEKLEFALQQILGQKGVELEVLVATHGFKAPEHKYAQVKFFDFSNQESLGNCLNAIIEEATGDYIAKMDDDDLYGPNYLRDQINALRYTGATVVGKQASYLYLENTDELVLRKAWREHLWTDLVLGATLVADRNTFQTTKFQDLKRGEDTRFLADVAAKGGQIYSSDRFNYIQIRSGRNHTWDVSDMDLKRNGRVETFGLNTKHVFVEES